MANRLGVLALAAGLAGCAAVPLQDTISRDRAVTIDVGANTSAKPCTLDAPAGARAGRVFCGRDKVPSARLTRVTDAGDLATIASHGHWRVALEQNLSCGAQQETTVLSHPAWLLACTQKGSGVPMVALLAKLNGQVWGAQVTPRGLPPAQRAIGVLAGLLPQKAASRADIGAGLAAARLAATAEAGGDANLYLELDRAAFEANRTGDFVNAEAADRQALAEHIKLVGTTSPYLVTDYVGLAEQVSAQGRITEANADLDTARALIAHGSAVEGDDGFTPAADIEYGQGIVLFNDGKYRESRNWLHAAADAYERARALDTTAAGAAGAGGATAYQEPKARNDSGDHALSYLIDARRHEAAALRKLGDVAASNAITQQVSALAVNNLPAGPDTDSVQAHVFETAAFVADSRGDRATGTADLQQSQALFNRIDPASFAAARISLIVADRQLRGGDATASVQTCRQTIKALAQVTGRIDPALLLPCLDAIWSTRARGGDAAAAGEMFQTAQLAQTTTTSAQIGRTALRLRQDPRVAEFYRRQDEALQALHSAEATLNAAGQTAAARDQAEQRRAAAARAISAAEASIEAGVPGYDELLPRSVAASELLAALRPREAFVSMLFGADHGWVFLLRDGSVTAARSNLGLAQIAALVKQVRATVDGDSPTPPPFATDADYTLYQAVLGGVAPRLAGAASLTVAPAGPLQSIPFAILLTAPASPDALPTAAWLLRQFPIAHVPAPSSLVSLRKLPPSDAARPYFGFGDFRQISPAQAEASFPPASCGSSARDLARLRPLPGSHVALRDVATTLGARPDEQLLGANYTAANVAALGQKLQDYRVLLFATHASLPTDLQCEAEPALVTNPPAGAPDASFALLTEDMIAKLTLRADLVILDGCNTGGPGVETKGESLSGLARSFFGAGTRALLVTQWPANDLTTTLLVTDFVKFNAQSNFADPAAALQRAQMNVLALAEGPAAYLGNPRYWGHVMLVGPAGTNGRHVVAGL